MYPSGNIKSYTASAFDVFFYRKNKFDIMVYFVNESVIRMKIKGIDNMICAIYTHVHIPHEDIHFPPCKKITDFGIISTEQ